MELLRAAFLGVVQGITEFLPVSSDGHLLLVRHLLRWSDEGLAFDAALHLGTFLALLWCFKERCRQLFGVIVGRGSGADHRLLASVLFATVPAAVFGFLGERAIAETFRGLAVAAGGFVVSALFLLLADRARRQRPAQTPELAVTFRQALLTGGAQALALLPGISRSATTMAGGILTGVPRAQAVEFSFLLALPIVGAAGLQGLLEVTQGDAALFLPLGVGVLLAFVTGTWVVRFLLRYLPTHSFFPFVVYLFGAAAVAALLP